MGLGKVIFYKVIRTLWESTKTMTNLTSTKEVRLGSVEDDGDLVTCHHSQGPVDNRPGKIILLYCLMLNVMGVASQIKPFR